MTPKKDEYMRDREHVCSRLHYSPETGEFRWKPRDGNNHVSNAWNARYAGAVAGKINTSGYRQISIEGKPRLAAHIAWLIVYGEWPQSEVIDHINGNPMDNRISNLRPATLSQNNVNTKLRKDNTSGVRGVSFYSREGTWLARIGVDGKRIHLGYFDKKSDAIEAYRTAARQTFGEFVRCMPIRFSPMTTKSRSQQ